MNRYAAFDLEIAKTIPAGAKSWDPYFPLGITCAAAALEGHPEPILWQGVPRLGSQECQDLVSALEDLVAQGHTLLTWNGCKFDFRVLGEEAGMEEACARLAADHVDLMLMFTFKQGHFLGLDKALRGSGVQGKRKQVSLSTGEVIENMDGALAPELWARGEHEAVLLYLKDDVRQPLELARKIEESGQMGWLTSRGGYRKTPFDRLYTVRECFAFPLPDTSWMRHPPDRKDFISWMPGGVLPAP